MEEQTTYEKPNELKVCFFITPIGDDHDDIRRSTDGLISLLTPVFANYGYKIVAAHTIAAPGNISDQIIEQILNAPLVLSNLTGLNSNVMYELGVRHATGLPTITIAQKPTSLPFDVTQERTIFYYDLIGYATKFIADIESTLKSIDVTKLPNNPVTRVKQQKAIVDNAALPDSQKLLFEKLNDIERLFTSQNSPVIQANNAITNIKTLTLRFDREIEASEYSKIVTAISNLWRISHTNLEIAQGIGSLVIYFYASGIVNHKLTLRTIQDLLTTENLPLFITAYWN